MPPRKGVLSCWTPLTTRLLEEGGSSAWHVMDGVMGEETCHGILEELNRAKLFEKLKPARTKGETKLEEIFALLQPNSSTPNELVSSQSPMEANIRGDKSLFLSREYRRQEHFQRNNPCLARFLELLQATLTANLSSNQWEVDPAWTSVQLAVYPGDGKSGYPRHCDRGKDSCQSDSTKDYGNQDPQRILTAIYYLTGADWHATRDGGALRLFHEQESTNTCTYTDVTPYRDRLLVFRSDLVEHQVLPSQRRPRTALTVWFYGRRKLHLSSFSKALEDNPISIPASFQDSTTSNTTSNASSKQTDPASDPHTTVGPPPLSVAQHSSHDAVATNKIFVAIASYRDSETLPTLQSLFQQAQYSERIVVGLTMQLDSSESEDRAIANSIRDFEASHSDQVRILWMDAASARGPCYARALGQSLWAGEDFYLQFDSHMRVRENWDTYLIETYQKLVSDRGHERIFLTTYPVGYTLPNVIPNETRGTLIVPWKFDNSGLLRQRGRLLKKRATPVPSRLVAGGFCFGPSIMLDEVPYDPHLHHLFFGEELTWSLRLYTHAYDGFAPSESVCYHLWSRSHRPTHRPQRPADVQARQAALTVVQNQLLAKKNHSNARTPKQQIQVFGRYGLGTIRTVAEYEEAVGVNFETREMNDNCCNGVLCSEDFVTSSTSGAVEDGLHPPDSLERKVAALDATIQDRIAFFLSAATPVTTIALDEPSKQP